LFTSIFKVCYHYYKLFLAHDSDHYQLLIIRLHNISFSIIGIFIYNQCYYQLYKYEYTKKKKNDDDIINDNDNDNDDIEYIKHPKHIRRLIAITLALYPLNFFYYFMYYTDTMR
jgi:hypothetical protein